MQNTSIIQTDVHFPNSDFPVRLLPWRALSGWADIFVVFLYFETFLLYFCIFKIWIFLLACCYGRLYLGGRWQKITFQLLQYSPGLDNILPAQTISSNCFNVHTVQVSSVREACAYPRKHAFLGLMVILGLGYRQPSPTFSLPMGASEGSSKCAQKHGITEEIHNETEKHTGGTLPQGSRVQQYDSEIPPLP